MQYDIFISHASEDKEEIARPLASRLRQLDLKVWFDESELTLGDSLRRKIDAGIANSRFGIVILSKAFFRKEWPNRELDAFFAREDDQEKVILPVWHGVDRAEIARYSPMLAAKQATTTGPGLENVVNAILHAVRRNGSYQDCDSFSPSQPQELAQRSKEPGTSQALVAPDIYELWTYSKSAKSSLEADRAILRENIYDYRFDEYDLGFQRKTSQALTSVLSHAGRDKGFLSPEELIYFSLVHMEASWLSLTPVEENKLGQKTFALGVEATGRKVHPVAFHLKEHNLIEGHSWNALSGLRATPIAQKSLADSHLERAQLALEPLQGATEGFPGWQESIEEMKNYQYAQLIVSAAYHPTVSLDATTFRYLDILRDRASHDPVSLKYLLRAELAVSTRCGSSRDTIKLIEQYRPQFINAPESRVFDILELNLFAESGGFIGDKKAISRMLSLDIANLYLLLKMHGDILLPSARAELWRRRASLSVQVQELLAIALKVSGAKY